MGGEGLTLEGERQQAYIIIGSTGGLVARERTSSKPSPLDAPVTMTVVGEIDIVDGCAGGVVLGELVYSDN